jgi:acyl-CoA thioesterase-1
MTEPAAAKQLRYVALGDSYTIGTSVGSRERWPDQLVASLGGHLILAANLGVNGYTSRDVIRRELPELERHAPEFVSILIGVNDVVQGVPASEYRRNAATILDELLVRLRPSRILAVGTPDYTVTPEGARFGDPRSQSAAIAENNATLHELSETRGIAFVDIFDLSRRAAMDPSLVANDGLHPSGAQYALWVDRIGPVVRRLLTQSPES